MNFLEVIFQILLVFAPHVGYLAQYQEIASSNSIAGYAPLVSLILLTSNTLRLFYYIGYHYMIALFFQAIVGVVVHFIVLLKVLDVNMNQIVSGRQEDVLYGTASNAPTPQGLPFSVEEAGGKPAAAVAGVQSPYGDTGRSGTGSATAPRSADGDVLAADEGANASPLMQNVHRVLHRLFDIEDRLEHHLLRNSPREFAMSYVMASAVTLAGVLVYYFTLGRVWTSAPAVIGYVSLGIEAMLVVPQILRNARRRSTEGLSLILILTWVVGDVIKVIYYGVKHQSLPFILCGVFQILLDCVVVAQLGFYRFYLRRDAAVTTAM